MGSVDDLFSEDLPAVGLGDPRADWRERARSDDEDDEDDADDEDADIAARIEEDRADWRERAWSDDDPDEDDEDDEDDEEEDDDDVDDEDDEEEEDEDADIAARIDRHLTALQAKHRFNGVAMVARQGEIALNEAYGYADVRRKKRLEPDFVFNLASVSKQFTAMAVMMLKEQGRLAYDDDVKRYIPELPYDGITVRNLLQHTAGLPEYFSMMEEPDDEDTLLTNRDVLQAFIDQCPDPDFAPGTRHEYCNTGYALLALVIEAASRQSYARFLTSAIFGPTRMKSTFVYDPEVIKPFQSRRACGFGEDGEDDMGYMDGIVGDGGIYSTSADLLLWDRALRKGSLVSAATFREALTPGRLSNGKTFSYGFGWFIEENLVWHSGSWAGFRTNITRYNDGDTVVLLTNDTNEDLDDIDEWICEVLSD